MKDISTLVKDVEDVLRNKDGNTIDIDQLTQLGSAIAMKVQRALTREDRERPPNTLYMSEIGRPCHRQVWYSVHMPELGEKLRPNTILKFLYGDILEEVLLFLAKQAGHTVENEQKRVVIPISDYEIVGRQDALIDNTMVDVKTASSYSFKKFKEGITKENDAFGYRAQLDGYTYPAPVWNGSGWFVVDKQNGTLHYSPHRKDGKEITDVGDVEFAHKAVALIEDVKRILPPKRRFDAVPEGKSGNMKLGVECSYCPYKVECWKDSNGGKGLRAFAYSSGPVFLTEVEKEPKVPELTLEQVNEDSTS